MLKTSGPIFRSIAYVSASECWKALSWVKNNNIAGKGVFEPLEFFLGLCVEPLFFEAPECFKFLVY